MSTSPDISSSQVEVPQVSVVIPVRNAIPWLDEAVSSILDQTHRDFELVIGDDASNDGSTERLEWWAAQDKRIRLMRHNKSLGPAGASNWVAKAARAPIIARMDADDVSHPERLERQLAIMEQNQQAVMVASTWSGIDACGRIVRPPDLAGLFQFDRFRRPFAHGSVMYRREAFHKVGGYRVSCDFWEDTDLFVRLLRQGEVLILRQPLYSYRYTRGSNRLHVDQQYFEGQAALCDACREAAAGDGDYETILNGSASELAAIRARRAGPAIFQRRATIEAWAGMRSHALFDWFRRGDKADLLGNSVMIAYIFWAFLHPPSMRAFLRMRAKRANAASQLALGKREYVVWGAGYEI